MLKYSTLRRERNCADFITAVTHRAKETNELSSRCCPQCNRRMNVARMTIAHPLTTELDLCLPCMCIWFDQGELQRIRKPPHRYRSQPSSEVRSITREAADWVKAEHERFAEERSKQAQPAKDDDIQHAWQVIPACLGLPVEHGPPKKKRFPVVTWSFAGVLVVTYIVSSVLGLDNAISAWGFKPHLWQRHFGIDILTCGLLHVGILHMAGNLYFLLLFGDNAEDDLGKLRYGLLLLTAHVVGMGCHILISGFYGPPIVGASAAISGAVAYYGIAFPNALLGFYWRVFYVPLKWFTLPAIVALVIWLALQGVIAALQAQGFTNVSGAAHLGGAAVGAGAATYLRISRSHARNGRHCSAHMTSSP